MLAGSTLPAIVARGRAGAVLRRLALLATVALAVGCADRRTPEWGGAPGGELGVSVHVTSDNFLDVVVYGRRDGSWHRLGTVTGLSSVTLDLPETLSAPPGRIQLRAHPIGAPDRGDYVSEVIYANPGDVIELRVASNVRMSSWYLRSGS